MSYLRLQDQGSNEDIPFLDDYHDEPVPEPGISSTPAATLIPGIRCQNRNHKPVIILLSVAKFVIVFSRMLMLTPTYRLLEDLFCHTYFANDSDALMDEMECKVGEVQSRLAFLMGWFGLLSSVMNLTCTYPYGIMADRVGRKPVILLAYGGMALGYCLIPLMLGPWKHTLRGTPNLMLALSLLNFIGGGTPVLMATVFAMAADVSNDENKTTAFLYLTIGAAGGALIGPLTAGLLMERFDPWAPIAVVICTIPVVFAVFVLIPETLTIHVKPQCTEDITMKKHVAHGVRDIVQSLRMLKDINIPLCLVTFFFAQVRFVAGSSTLVQYITTNFGWTMAQTTIFLSPLGIIEIMTLTSLPRISEIMTSRLGFTSFGKDLYLTQVSFLVLTISAFIRAVSSSIWLFLIGLFMGTFGSAESALARATVSAYVEPSHTSRLFALAGTVDVLGSFAAGPAMAWLFDKGMRWGGIWTGLPWLYLGLTSGLCWLGLRFARSPKKGCDHEGVFGDGEVGNSRTRNLLG